MQIRLITVFLSLLSGLGVSYFVIDTWRSFGVVSQFLGDTRVLVTAIVATIVPLVIAWAGLWWVYNAKTTRGYILKLLGSSLLAWAFLFFGSLYLALLRFQ